MQMTKKLTIAIPTHNRVDLLKQTFVSLSRLHVPTGVELELVVVADSCTDGTVKLVKSFEFPFRSELIEGGFQNLNMGRNACVSAARGEIILFLDDDVWADPSLVIGHLETFQETPASVSSGEVELWWRDVERPSWMSGWTASLLTERQHGGRRAQLSHPWEAAGANFAIRREVVGKVGGFLPGLDRSGTGLLGGGETEFIRRAQSAGLQLWSAPRARVKHYVSSARVNGPTYVRGVARGLGRSHIYMRSKLGPAQVARQIIGRGALACVHGGRHLAAKVRSDAQGAVDAACDIQICLGAIEATIARARGRSPVVTLPPKVVL
jgi:glycosyltransferase involved in cell wall biosynthesis